MKPIYCIPYNHLRKIHNSKNKNWRKPTIQNTISITIIESYMEVRNAQIPLFYTSTNTYKLHNKKDEDPGCHVIKEKRRRTRWIFTKEITYRSKWPFSGSKNFNSIAINASSCQHRKSTDAIGLIEFVRKAMVSWSKDSIRGFFSWKNFDPGIKIRDFLLLKKIGWLEFEMGWDY